MKELNYLDSARYSYNFRNNEDFTEREFKDLLWLDYLNSKRDEEAIKTICDAYGIFDISFFRDKIIEGNILRDYRVSCSKTKSIFDYHWEYIDGLERCGFCKYEGTMLMKHVLRPQEYFEMNCMLCGLTTGRFTDEKILYDKWNNMENKI